MSHSGHCPPRPPQATTPHYSVAAKDSVSMAEPNFAWEAVPGSGQPLGARRAGLLSLLR